MRFHTENARPIFGEKAGPKLKTFIPSLGLLLPLYACEHTLIMRGFGLKMPTTTTTLMMTIAILMVEHPFHLRAASHEIGHAPFGGVAASLRFASMLASTDPTVRSVVTGVGPRHTERIVQVEHLERTEWCSLLALRDEVEHVDERNEPKLKQMPPKVTV